ncbi:hypothetical protein shim_03100 [Shimia sp. SK013]|uniref:hypothetical protein n=1 Tax=Shimia sp. SK013 TaxID=1389006 RepID=UPI0006CC5907|nr:hypothetical protein [Shimia sp. SK013]KPA23377.1 hypothetical protein shim_03100 [Shimia sp. SK013]
MKHLIQTAAVAMTLLGATATIAIADRKPALDPGCEFIKELNEYTCPTCGC